jgi:hypothetical protein
MTCRTYFFLEHRDWWIYMQCKRVQMERLRNPSWPGADVAVVLFVFSAASSLTTGRTSFPADYRVEELSSGYATGVVISSNFAVSAQECSN